MLLSRLDLTYFSKSSRERAGERTDSQVFVYFIQQGIDGPVKIGKADRPDRRLASLQGANPESLRLRAVCRGDAGVERHLHRYFADERLGDREWFSVSDRLAEFLNKLPNWEEVKAGAHCPVVLNTRDHIACRLYLEGYTHRDIGELFGLTYQRSQQIVAEYSGDEILTNLYPHGRREKPSQPIEDAYARHLAELGPDDLVLGRQ
jgi:hypothetical protein